MAVGLKHEDVRLADYTIKWIASGLPDDLVGELLILQL